MSILVDKIIRNEGRDEAEELLLSWTEPLALVFEYLGAMF